MTKVVYGPEVSFYDDREEPEEFRILREEDGVFLEFCKYGGNGLIVGCTLVDSQIKELIRVLRKELKRL